MRGFEVDYDRRLQDLIGRRTAPVELIEKSARYGKALAEAHYYQASPQFEVYNRLGKEGSAVRYTVGAMARVDPRYTEITYDPFSTVESFSLT